MGRKIIFALVCLVIFSAGGYIGSATIEPEIIAYELEKIVEKPIYITKELVVEKEIVKRVPISLRPFDSRGELEQWLESYKPVYRFWGSVDLSKGLDCDDMAYSMMISAVEDGFIISTEVTTSNGHMLCTAPVFSENRLYFINPPDREITGWLAID